MLRLSTKVILLFLGLLILGELLKHYIPKKESYFNEKNYPKTVWIMDNGIETPQKTNCQTVDELIKEDKITLGENDLIFPERTSEIFNGSKIEILRAVKLNFHFDGNTKQGYALSKTIRGAILENGILLNRLDISDPQLENLPENNLNIYITRINIEERVETESINFKTITQNDSSLGWQEKKTIQAGQVGSKEVLYRIHYRNGKEINREILSQKIVSQPTDEVVIQGTLMKLGKSDRGLGTWYAFKGGMFAASKKIPKGGYAKVTNMENGKSIVVQINDYGPVDPKRIIDLDKVAFQKLAPLGVGVIHDIKVEQILN